MGGFFGGVANCVEIEFRGASTPSTRTADSLVDSKQVANAAEASAAFDSYLTAACAAPAAERQKLLLDWELGRRKLLLDWEQAPHARSCHPPGGEEHLLPLLVVVGRESGTKLWTDPDFFGRVTMSSWGFSV